MSKPDYKLKSKIIREYKNLDLYNKCKKVLYKSFYVGNVTQEEFDNAGHTLKMLEDSNPTEYKEYFRILDAKHKRVSRLRARIFDMIYKNDCLFLTFTFRDKTMNNTSAYTRRRYVKYFLNALPILRSFLLVLLFLARICCFFRNICFLCIIRMFYSFFSFFSPPFFYFWLYVIFP